MQQNVAGWVVTPRELAWAAVSSAHLRQPPAHLQLRRVEALQLRHDGGALCRLEQRSHLIVKAVIIERPKGRSWGGRWRRSSGHGSHGSHAIRRGRHTGFTGHACSTTRASIHQRSVGEPSVRRSALPVHEASMTSTDACQLRCDEPL